jgi:hypothetical protein
MLSSEMINLASPLAVVSNDAGATNLIIGWLRERKDILVRTCLQGAAVELWSQAFPQWCCNMSISESLDGTRVLLSGTSWMSNLEHDARRIARILGIPSIGVIDHWVNYTERFIRNEEQILPDEIWVADEYALLEAKKYFSGIPIVQLPNKYLEGMVSEINVYSKLTDHNSYSPNVLYVLEPVRLKWGADERSGEFQALDYFMERLAALGLSYKTAIRLRPHPSDKPGKYDVWLNDHFMYNLTIDTQSSLVELIAWSDWVVGCETFAMVVALQANRRVISTIPPWAPSCRLPQKEIIHLRSLSRDSK